MEVRTIIRNISSEHFSFNTTKKFPPFLDYQLMSRTKNRQNVKQKEMEVLCVSQFTLYGTLSKKNQPDYKLAMKTIPAEELYARFLCLLRESYDKDRIFDGKFGEMMDVELVNDGPVTLIIESIPKNADTLKDA